ncbi:hypothetical protein BY458DRAFT_590329 [Sporodiniella umbellata]|nr:hypothetical protein BY458DRAFT_590329 [Sporodiniella umbellata]
MARETAVKDYHRFLFRSSGRLELDATAVKVIEAMMETLVPVLSDRAITAWIKHRPDHCAEQSFLPEQQAKFVQAVRFLCEQTPRLDQCSVARRTALVLEWTQHASTRAMVGLFRSLTLTVVYRQPPALVEQALGWPPSLDGWKAGERLPVLDMPVPHQRFDTIVIGSGAGGGVVASELAAHGQSVLVIEKGKYKHESKLGRNEAEGYRDLYESSGLGISVGGHLGIVTATFDERKESMGRVRIELFWFSGARIGASTENVTENGSGDILLGIDVATIPQNTGGQRHACGTCHLGCRQGVKQGTVQSWLSRASKDGAQLLDQTRVKRVIVRDGRAVGVLCELRDGSEVTIEAGRVVVSAGTLQSPGLLLRSGLKNALIGQSLKLHEGRSYSNAVYEAGDFYLASVFLPPLFYCHYFPWENGAAHKDTMLDIHQAACFVVMVRDQDSKGSVDYDAEENARVHYTLSAQDAQSMMKGILKGADGMVSAGARKVACGQHYQAPFEFKPGEERSINHPRFLAWKERLAHHGLVAGDYFCGAAHPMCTNRMGISPDTSVVQPTGETWEIENLYVADASVLPTSLGVNPMVTIEAVALSIAGSILKSQSRKQ